MASAFCQRAFLLLQLLQLCSGQYYYYYDNGGYDGDYGNDNSWCPFGVNGLCTCENDIVDCTDQGLLSVPPDLPATTKQLILKNNRITTVDFMPLTTYSSLEVLDLSSNDLTTLPYGILEYLPYLHTINLSDNPWVCDCSLKWLSMWMLTTAANSNVQLVDVFSTNCVDWPTIPIISLLPANFLPCAPAPVRALRSAIPAPTQTFSNWSSVCEFWFSQNDCAQGPSDAGSCVLSSDSLDVALVQYSDFTSQSNAVACRDYCFLRGYSFHAFQNSTFLCMCGEDTGSNTCSECTSANLTSSAVTLCRLMRVPVVDHVLSEVGLTFTSPVYTHSPVTFTVTGISSVVSSLSWSFGDGAKRDNTTATTVNHTYTYTGSFPARLELCGSGACRAVQVHVRVDTSNTLATLTCPSVSEVTEKINLNVTLSNAYSSTVEWMRSSSADTIPVGGCSSGWTAFNDRCVKYLTRTKTFAKSEKSCTQNGGIPLKLHNLKEEQQLLSVFGLSVSSTAWIGAKYNGTMYRWEASSEEAHFLRALAIDHSAGDCLVMSVTGLVAADCSSKHRVLCQQDAVQCPLGQQLGSEGLCYYLETVEQNWTQARSICQGYNDGDLAILSDQTLTTVVTTSLGVNRTTWMGLSAPDLLGYYTWVDGHSLSWQNWASSVGPWGTPWPCVSMTSHGDWEPTACDQTLSFVCQYSLKDSVTTEMQVAGTVDLKSNSTFASLNPYTNTLPQNAGQTIVMPGVWFAKDGQLLELNLKVEPQSSSNIVGVLVLRPTCPSGNVVIRPGCNQSVFAGCGSAAAASSCPALPTCLAENEHPCPLSNVCVASSTPCSCASPSSSSHVDCSNTDVDPDLEYSLIGEAVFEIPAAGGAYRAEIRGGIDVQTNDILAFQSRGSDFGFCQVDPSSQWKQVVFIRVGYKWEDANNAASLISLSSYNKQENYVCRVSAVYGSPKTVVLPDSLAYVPDSMIYTFDMEVQGAKTIFDSCQVETVQEIGDLVWLYPAITTTTTAGSSVVYVEAGVQQNLVVMVRKGTLEDVLWQVSTGALIHGAGAAACPSSVAANVTQCQNSTSELAQPFLVYDDTFSTSTPVSLTLNVSNALGWKSVSVVVNAVDPIQNLVLYHSNCSAVSACAPVVEVGVDQLFLTSKTSGSVDLYEFQEDGTVIQSSQSPSLTHRFASPGLYVISVNASNGLNSMAASLQVSAKVRAQVTSLTLEPASPVFVEAGSNLTVILKASVTQGAEVTVTWDYGDGAVESSTQQASSYKLELDKTRAYNAPGQYTLEITVQDAFGEAVNITSVINVLSVIDQVTAQVASNTIAAGSSSSITVQVQSKNSSNPNFHTITYNVDFKDGSGGKTVHTTQTSKTFHHVYHASGTYIVEILVRNRFSSQSTTTVVFVQECPTAVTLLYDGPKNVSQQLTFTATVDKGSNLNYTFNFGDGSPIIDQLPNVIVHTYSTSNSYNASVIARNAVCSVSDLETVIVMNASTLRVGGIIHNPYAANNEAVDFTVEIITLDMQKVSLTWKVQMIGSTVINTLTKRGSNTFRYPFQVVGNYTVLVEVTLDNGPSTNASTTITSQEPVTSVSLTAPSLVSFTYSKPASVPFSATSTNGTNVDFQWYNNGVLLSNQGPSITLLMSTAGLSNISVEAFNEVSRVGDWFVVDVQHTIENVALTCLTCINSKFISTHFVSEFNCTYLGTSASVEWAIGAVTGQGNPFQHTFSVAGIHLVNVSVTNLVSSQNALLEVVVEEALSALTLVADQPVTGEGTSIQLTANHSQGTAVVYTWQCGSQPAYNTSSSFTRVVFNIWGLHTCSVMVANNVSSLKSTVDIEVLQNITSLGIKNLTAGSMLYVPVNAQPGVEIDCNTYFGVNFTWIIMKSGAVISRVDGLQLTYTFLAEGRYELKLDAVNAISVLSVNVSVQAQVEISNLTLTANDTTLQVGDGVEFSAYVVSGTNPQFNWSVDGMPLLSVSGLQSFSYSFNSAGSYVIEVNATNQLSFQNTTITILVQFPVQNVSLSTSLDLGHPFVSLHSQLTFHSQVLQGSDPVSHWTVDSPSSRQTHLGTTLQQTFSETGDYNILLVVSNKVSQDSLTFIVYVEKAISSLNLTVVPSTIVATGTMLSFLGASNSDAYPVNYSWTIHGQTFTGANQSQTFSVAGFYSIKLQAKNNISSLEEKETIEVQDPVTGLQMSDCNVTRQSGIASNLSAAAQGTNISFSWIVQLPTQNKTSRGPTLTLVFPTAGRYPVHLIAGNKVKQETLTCTVLVQDAIANVAVHIDDPPINYIFTNQNITFSITGDHLTSAVYTWDFVGVFQIQTNTPVYIRSFPTAQIVRLEVTVANNVSQQQVSVNFTVQDLQCNLPTVTPVGPTSRSVLRSKTTQFDVYIDNAGCSLYVVIHAWNVYNASDCTQVSSASAVTLPSVDTGKPTLVLPASLLPATKQQFCVHYVLGYQNTPVAEEMFYNLTVLSSPLVAVIRHGAWRQVDGSGPVCLDGSPSYNPDLPTGGSSGMTYAWTCQPVASGSSNCFNAAATSTSSELCMSNLTAGTYNITLTITLPGSFQAAGSASQIVEVQFTTPPILSVGVECVSCQATGDYRISANHHLALAAQCEGCGANMTYTWTVTQNGGTPVSIGSGDTSTGTTAARLVILRNTVLKDGSSYTFMVTVGSVSGNGQQGKAYITLQPNLPPSGGTCTASPTTIEALQEYVTVSCDKWTDSDNANSQLLYEIKAVQNSQTYLLYYGVRSTQAIYVAPLPGAANSSTQLVISVMDEYGARTEALSTWISFKDPGISANNMSQELYLAANTTLTTLMQQGDPVPLLQYSLALAHMLNAASQGSLSTSDLVMQDMVRTAITVCVSSRVTIETVQQVQQMAYLLEQLTEYSAEFQTSGCQTLTLRSLQDIITFLQNNARPGQDRDNFAFESLYITVYNLMQAVSSAPSTSSSSSVTSLGDMFPLFADLSTWLGSVAQSLDFSTVAVSQSHKEGVVTSAFSLAESVTSTVLQAILLDEEGVTYQVGGLQVDGQRLTVGTVSSFMEQGGCGFILPGSMFQGSNLTQEILQIMIMMDPNPYTWGYIDNHTVDTRLATLSFQLSDGSDLQIQGLSIPIEIRMFASDGNNYTVTNSSLVQNPHYDPLAGTVFETWTLGKGESKKLEIDAEVGTCGVSSLHVMVRVQALPNQTNQLSGIVPRALIKAYLGVDYEASEDSYADFKEIATDHMMLGVDHRSYTFFVSSQEFCDSKSYSITLVNDDVDHDVNISSTVYLSSCQYFDEGQNVWSADGCSVMEESIPLATACLCNHLTAFGGSSLVPISSIRFTDLAALELGLNPVTLIAVGALLVAYIVGVIVCRHLDRADLRRISLVPLCGRDGAFKYHITIITGRQIGAGTSAHIGIKLYGENGKSEARHLTKCSAFQRNSRDTFLIATDIDLGAVHKVRVWHDNTGASPAWYLTQIQVQDFQSGERFVFPANTWLSLELEDGILQTQLYVAGEEELHSFSRVFKSALANSMAERHMWLSVFNRPDHSRFTRVQRITCCITLVYLYMFLNAMWYGLIKDQSDASDSMSWNVIGWEEVLIALVSVATIFPVALVLICIFKRSRSKADVFTQAMRPQSAQTLEIDAMCDVSPNGGSLRTMTPNEDWSTIFERESTTESIPNSPRILRSPHTPRTPRTPRSSYSPRNSPNSPEEPISSQLRRTTAVNRSSRDASVPHGSFPGSSRKSSLQVIRRTQELMWNQENILKSWPEKLPSFAEEEKEKEKSAAAAATSSASGSDGTAAADDSASMPSTSGTAVKSGSAASGSGTTAAKISKTMSMTNKQPAASSLKKTNSAPSKPSGLFVKNKTAPPPPPSKAPVTTRKTASFKMDTENDSDDHEEFMQKLDQLDRELKKSSSIRSRASLKSGMPKGLVKKHSSHSSQSAIDDLFESDDEWASEGLDGKGGRRVEGATFNPRQDPMLDRRASMTSLMKLRMASMHMPSSAGSSMVRRDSTFMRRDSTFNSFLMSEKSRTTLSALLKNRMQLLGHPTEDRGCRLPWFCVYVGYGICLALSMLSILMVLLYGYNFGSAVALQWLLSVLLAFLCSMLLLEPLKVVILALYVAVVTKDAEKDVEADSIDVMPSIEANEQLKEVKFRPLGGFALLQAHKEGRKKLRLRTMIRQTIAYLVLTATALAIANVYFGPNLFRAMGHMENSFLYTDTTYSGLVDFDNISSTDQFWSWARDVWVPALYRQDLVSNEENPVLLGPARLRQVRSTMVDCLTNEVEKVRSCVGRLEFTEDTAAYSPGWLNTSAGNASWVHSSAEQLDTRSKFGWDLIYSGGGYVQVLGMSYNQTLDVLQQLDDDRWLDRSSRALFLEWTSYSAGEDIFIAATLLLELPISGGVLASHDIQSQRLYIFNPDRVEPLYVCQVLMLLPALYLLIHTILLIREQRSQFVRSPSNWLQLGITLVSMVSIGMYIGSVATATDTLKRFSSGSSTSFTNFERAVHLHDVLRVLHACLIFLLLLKIAGQVRFIRPLSVYPRTLATASGRMLGATFIFLLLLLTYTQLGYLFYGTTLEGYRSFQNALLSLLGVMKGTVNLSSELEHQRIFSHFFFYSFYAFVYGLFVALVIAILQDAYKLTRSQMFFKSSLEPQDYEMIDFLLKRFKLWAGITKPKPAFRRVQFEGQPSLPSRGSSSATSSRRSPSQNSMEGSTPTPDLIASTSKEDALDKLLPTWERLLSLLNAVESLDKEDQQQVGRVQIACNRLTSEQDKKAGAKKNPQGKPPVNPKSKFSRFRLNFQASNSEQNGEQRHTCTPPPAPRDKEGSTYLMMRTLSDQGGCSFGLPERPASESQKVRPSPGLTGDPSEAGVKDTFPGSTSQWSHASSSVTRSAADASAAASQRGPASAIGPVRTGPGHAPANPPTSQTAAEDSKKKAWEG